MSVPIHGPADLDTALARAWAVLDPPRTTELAAYPVATVPAGLPCRVALDRDGLRHLLVPADGETLPPDSTSSVLSGVMRSLRFDGDQGLHLDIRCSDHDLDDEFDEVVADILDQVGVADTPGAVALETLGRWRRLFSSRLVRGLSARARIGLFAELTVLRALLTADPHLAVEVWTGPLGSPHDFETPGRCLEVKAAGEDPSPIVINGIDQLDTHDRRDLDLLVVTVVPDPQGTTLTSLIDTVSGTVTDPAALEERLRRLGWQPDLLVGDTEGLVVGGLLRVPITDDTPRLVPAALAAGRLPEGVDRVSYRIERNVLASHSAAGSLSEIAADATRSAS